MRDDVRKEYFVSFLNPIIFVKRGINPPKSKVVKSTTTNVDVTMRPALGESGGLI